MKRVIENIFNCSVVIVLSKQTFNTGGGDLG